MSYNSEKVQTEYFGIYVTKEVKKRLEDARDNHKLQLDIITDFLSGEKDWLSNEIKLIDEETLKYRHVLLKLKESFTEHAIAYEAEINSIAEALYKKESEISKKLKPIENSINSVCSKINAINNSIDSMSLFKLEKGIELIEKFNRLSDDDKDVFKQIFKLKN